eukprot:PhM_4_TR5969/c0_g1_i1/m.3841
MSRRIQSAVPAHHQITVRQHAEDVITSYTKHVAEDKRVGQVGHWEAKTTRRVVANQVIREADKIEAQYNEVLAERRRRLAALLASERDQYERELVASTETETQRRDRIATEALKLRNEREQIRKMAAQELHDKQFAESCVPLREARSKLMTLKCVSERAQQLEAQKERKHADNNEKEFFEALEAKTRAEAEAKQRQELEQRRAKTALVQSELERQRAANDTLKSRSREIKRMEDEAFTQTLQQMQAEDEAKDQQRRERQRELVAKNRAFNEELELEKQHALERKREEDRKELTALVESIRAEEQAEQDRKIKRKQEALAQRKEAEQALRVFADNQNQLDSLWQDESDKQWDKLESRRGAEQEARERAAREVHAKRIEQIRSKRAAKVQGKEDQAKEREAFHKDHMETMRQLAEKRAAERERAIRNQSQLKQQLAEHEARRRLDEDYKLEEVAAAYAAEQHYAQRMSRELSALEQAKPSEFSTMPIIGSRRIV